MMAAATKRPLTVCEVAEDDLLLRWVSATHVFRLGPKI